MLKSEKKAKKGKMSGKYSVLMTLFLNLNAPPMSNAYHLSDSQKSVLTTSDLKDKLHDDAKGMVQLSAVPDEWTDV